LVREEIMKRLLILCVLLLCIVPFVSANEAWNCINQGVNTNGNNWTANASGDAASAYKAGDCDINTKWAHYQKYDGGWITWYNPTGVYYSKVRIWNSAWSGETTLWTCNNVDVYAPGSVWTNISLSGGGGITCTNITSSQYPGISEIQYLNGTPPVPAADFTGAPLNGVAPLTVVFTDTSTDVYGTATYNWSISPIVSGNIGNSGLNRNQTTYFVNTGLYTVTHGVETPYGSDIESKTAYVNVTNASSLITAYISAIDQVNGYRVLGADISIFDVENASWSNSTADPDGMYQISTVFGNHLNAYASAFGYTSGENLGISNIFNNVDYAVYMTNPNSSQASAGNVTLNIRVEDGNTLQPLAGAAVSGVSSTGAGFNIISDAQGIVNVAVPNKTTYAISATKTNYIMGTKNVYTGTAIGPGAVVPAFILLYPSSVTQPPSVTQTTLPGGGTPAPTLTYLANCNPSLPDYDAAKCRTAKGGMGLNILADNLENLIWLVLIVTMIYLLKGIGK
jgi:PKD repeat protein